MPFYMYGTPEFKSGLIYERQLQGTIQIQYVAYVLG